ncbi:nucleoid-associated protein [Paractinoplanes durhamensis]|uniref:Nucleoid-associated protein Adu01nite_72670 n=2 Tax=Paractinoplanes durhamensis TaxID=113563 RepID=A0ABQ3Z7V4_9ACTN|nr:nucleoid-associated protein [Actinoplanes durhamensis]
MRPGGQPNMQNLMAQAQKMQQLAAAAEADLAAAELTGNAGGGLVTVVLTGLGEVKSVRIDPKAVDPEDIESLEDLVTAAFRNAAEAQRELAEEKRGAVTGGLDLGMLGF